MIVDFGSEDNYNMHENFMFDELDVYLDPLLSDVYIDDAIECHSFLSEGKAVATIPEFRR